MFIIVEKIWKVLKWSKLICSLFSAVHKKAHLLVYVSKCMIFPSSNVTTTLNINNELSFYYLLILDLSVTTGIVKWKLSDVDQHPMRAIKLKEWERYGHGGCRVGHRVGRSLWILKNNIFLLIFF
jgi:hypothetical protein